MDSKQFEHPLKFFNEIANEVQRENPSHTLFLIFTQHRKEMQIFLQKPEVQESIKKKGFIPNNPETFNAWVMSYLIERSSQVRPKMQTYTSTLESEEKIKTYITQQYRFICNHEQEIKDSYYKAFLAGSTGNPQKAGIMIALSTIIANIKTDYRNYIQEPQKKILKSEFETIDYALFHYYKQAGKHEPGFELIGKVNKREAMRRQGISYKVGAEAFVLAYYSIQYGKEKKRISKANLPHIAKAIELLSGHPAGLKIAQEELKEAELLP